MNSYNTNIFPPLSIKVISMGTTRCRKGCRSPGQQFPGRQWCRHQYLQGYGQSILREGECRLDLENRWGRLACVEFGVVGGSSTHTVEGADMETMRQYQMLYPNINSSRVRQIGHAKQTMIETRGDKFVIGHEASKDAPQVCHWPWGLKRCPSLEDFVSCNGLWPPRVSMICPSSEDFVLCNGFWPRGSQWSAPHWRTLSCATDFNHQGSQWSAPCWRTLSCATDFVRQGSQWSATHRRTLSHATDFDHKGPQWSAPHQRTLSCTNDKLQSRWVTRYKQEQAEENSGADKASRECITLMKVEDFALDAWLMLGWSLC